MQFDLHSELANQITIENLKCHRNWMVEDLPKMAHDEDREQFSKDLEAMNRVLEYFCGTGN